MIFNFDKFKDINIYGVSKSIKNKIFLKAFKKLISHHSMKCIEYGTIVKSLGFRIKNLVTINDIPYLPTRLFKNFELKSIKNNNIFKILKSSGTTGQKTSRIILDRENASNQVKVLNKIVSNVLGKKRLPMLIIDTDLVLKDKNRYSLYLS